jgi:molybdopterin-biosynthesis enzyme MoeA-like protein
MLGFEVIVVASVETNVGWLASEFKKSGFETSPLMKLGLSYKGPEKLKTVP